jgi:ferredoxin
MAKVLVIHPERYTTCRACELACSMKHHGEFNLSRSRIQVNIFLEDALYTPTACTQCDQAWCAKICPTNATVREVMDQLGMPPDTRGIPVLGGKQAAADTVLKEGETLAIFPPLAGGGARTHPSGP